MLIAAPSSGAGKTTVALALIAAARRRGLVVQPFKIGPDFIDPGHHARVAGRSARTLDGWMLGERACRASFRSAMAAADVALVEGMMGLFDGVGAAGESGSSAEMAKWLQLPVLLVVDAGAMARSAAAVVRGFRDFDPALRIAAVIFNRIGGPGHLALLRDALAAAGLPPCLGGLPTDARFTIPERHLGLVTDATVPIEALAEAAERHLEVDAILRLTPPSRRGVAQPPAQRLAEPLARPLIAIAHDEAFSFYYPENLELLERAGATLVEFSPLADTSLPSGVSGVYLGGGYPEMHAARLAANTALLAELRTFASAGGLVYGECGGLMVLGESLEDAAGHPYRMAGVLPLRTRMLPRALTLGYREVTIAAEFLPPLTARGHEFHASTLDGPSVPPTLARVYLVRDPTTATSAREGFSVRRTLASYVHLHFASAPALATALVAAARRAAVDLAGTLPAAEATPR